MATATLTISSKNYSSWSLRGWLLTKFSGLPFTEKMVPTDDAAARAEILLLAPSMRVPCLEHDGISVWDTMAISEYLNEVCPQAGCEIIRRCIFAKHSGNPVPQLPVRSAVPHVLEKERPQQPA